MTALEEYAKSVYYDCMGCLSLVGKDKADAAIESLKCCGNCGRCDLDYEHGVWELACVEDRNVWITPSTPCYFAPSRWKERE